MNGPTNSETGTGTRTSPSPKVSLFGQLIKSKQTFLLLYTTIFVYLISIWGSPFVWEILLWVSISLFFAISGTTILNMYIDRDIDLIMERTQGRPLPTGEMKPRTVLIYGSIFTAVGILLSGIFLNLLTMLVVFTGFFFDVVVYSLLLKRRTRFSILFGGIAGGLPALAGRTAVLGVIDLTGILVSLFVICWIPLHILTLSLFPKNLKGYRESGIPMWPVVKGEKATIRVITISGVISAIVIILSGIVLEFHILALLPLIVVSLVILMRAVDNLREPTFDNTFKIFKLASMYMGFAFLWLFLGLVISPYLPLAFQITIP